MRDFTLRRASRSGKGESWPERSQPRSCVVVSVGCLACEQSWCSCSLTGARARAAVVVRGWSNLCNPSSTPISSINDAVSYLSSKAVRCWEGKARCLEYQQALSVTMLALSVSIKKSEDFPLGWLVQRASCALPCASAAMEWGDGGSSSLMSCQLKYFRVVRKQRRK